MKKFISMVMAAAMVVSLVPATAFAYELSATAKVLDAAEMTETQAKAAKKDGINTLTGVDKPELQLKITDADYTADEKNANGKYEYELTLELDGAEWATWTEEDATAGTTDNASVSVAWDRDGDQKYNLSSSNITFSDVDKNEATIKIEVANPIAEDDKIIIDLSQVKVTKTSAGSEATVSVDSDDLGVEATGVIAVVQDNVLTIDVDDTVDVAEEEVKTLEDVTIEAATGNLPWEEIYTADEKEPWDLKLRLNAGFEFTKANEDLSITNGEIVKIDDNVLYVNVGKNAGDKLEIKGLEIEATTAKAGDIAVLKVTAGDWEGAEVEVAVVVGEGLVISVDEDEDVPEMWSGVAADTEYLTDDDDNTSLTFTIKETVGGSYSEKDEVELVLPEGVWVVGAETGVDVDVEEIGDDEAANNSWTTLFKNAYQESDHTSFLFEKRTIKESKETAWEIEVALELVADPGFVGDVTVEMLVDGEKVGEVVVATFKTPLIVEAQQNDLKIDYRNTEVGSDIVVKEAEAGLWAEGLVIGFGIDKFEDDCFENDMVYTVNESDMEIDGEDDYLQFEVEEESDEDAAVITISNLSLYMERNIPAGAYDLTMYGNVFGEYNAQVLYAPDCNGDCDAYTNKDNETVNICDDKEHEYNVDDVQDYSDVVKEGFVNIVTAGREQDDASFTTKVVVPVGESYIVAGEQTITLDVPAYVSAEGYTMLPVRAVATGLGINNNNVLWDQATKTVTILYGQRIITMVAGQKVINVNGSVIPASASVEVVDGRAFLPMRDLATALGVTDITWDGATKTATLNGNA